MEETAHTLLVGEGARKFADSIDFPHTADADLVTEVRRAQNRRLLARCSRCSFSVLVSSLCSPSLTLSSLVQFAVQDLAKHKSYGGAVSKLFHEEGHDTVGCVAIDANGNIACGTSTGGITNKKPGRVGDSPLVGCGGYADENGGCSATGHGEALTKTTISSRAVALLGDHTPDDAARVALEYAFKRVNGRGGLIIIDERGKIGRYATTPCMAWASVTDGEMASGVGNDEVYKLFPEQEQEEAEVIFDGGHYPNGVNSSFLSNNHGEVVQVRKRGAKRGRRAKRERRATREWRATNARAASKARAS